MQKSEPFDHNRNRLALTAARAAGLASLYFTVGMLGLLLTAGFGRAQIVWSSTGIAFAGLALFGLRYWPAVAIADLLLSIAAGYGFVAAIGISGGKVVGTVIGVFLYTRYAGRRRNFRTVADVLLFIFAAACGSIIGGSIGTLSMIIGDVRMEATPVRVWSNWWFGDLLSDLVLAPLVLNLSTAPWRSWRNRQVMEAFLLLALLLGTAAITFTGNVKSDLLLPYTFPLFPLMIWASLRFEQTGAALASLIIALLAMATATRNTPPSGLDDFNRALLTVHAYMFVIAITSYCLAAAVAARRHAQDHLHAVSLELRALAQKLEVAREQERVHLAREIHDQLGQQLTGIGLALASLKRKLPDSSDAASAKAGEMEDILKETIETVQRLATELRPGVINELSLPEALQWLADKSAKELSLPVTFRNEVPELTLDPQCKLSVFRIFQEAFVNVARHSGASAAILQVARRDGNVVIALQDDGIGMDESAKSSQYSLGIVGMRERAHACGAELRIEKAPFLGTPERPGTMISVVLPETVRPEPVNPGPAEMAK